MADASAGPSSPYSADKEGTVAVDGKNGSQTSGNAGVGDKEVPLALPAPGDAVERKDMHMGHKFDDLGPMVVNSNGSLSRIANWKNMTDREKATAFRLLSKRNKIRKQKIRAEAEVEGGSGDVGRS